MIDGLLQTVYKKISAAVAADVLVSPVAVESSDDNRKYVVYTNLSSEEEASLSGGGVVSARVSIVCWATRFSIAADLAETVKTAFENNQLLADYPRIINYRLTQEVDELANEPADNAIYGRNLIFTFMLC